MKFNGTRFLVELYRISLCIAHKKLVGPEMVLKNFPYMDVLIKRSWEYAGSTTKRRNKYLIDLYRLGQIDLGYSSCYVKLNGLSPFEIFYRYNRFIHKFRKWLTKPAIRICMRLYNALDELDWSEDIESFIAIRLNDGEIVYRRNV